MYKLEEFRVACVRKFADKQEVLKNFKNYDNILKGNVDFNKKDKNENWLLAKKPFGGNSCASCEAYIGELTENKDYVAWNKLRESNDRMYPLGSGFSKMLQIVNINEKKENDIDVLNTNQNMTSQNFNKKYINTTVNLNYSLPKVKPKQKKEKSANKNKSKDKHTKTKSQTKINNASINVSYDSGLIRDDDEITGAKVTKIYKIKENK